jgi:hypothetical protein
MPVSHSEHLHGIYLKTVEQRERILRQREEIELRRAQLWERLDLLRAGGYLLSRPVHAPWPGRIGTGMAAAADSRAGAVLSAGSADCSYEVDDPSCLVPAFSPGD